MDRFSTSRFSCRRAAVACLVLVLPLVACANTSKDDAANCASQGFVAGTADYNACISKLQQRRAALATLNRQEDPVAKLNGNLSGRYHNGCSYNSGRTTCDDPF
jgi:hypothetical protein